MQDFIINNDLEFEAGDLMVGFSDEYHQKHILIAEKGEYKQFPELGVGMFNLLNSEEMVAMLIEARRNFEYDGMRVDELRFSDENTLVVKANYR
ncbi:hypothetical protein [Pedobacter sp.]|uniref:hypothetical protein n=1 Tax=Pedobacter sp. TaxID=1411316 RepID=UPI0031D3ACA1